MEDITPPMGSMPVQLVGNQSGDSINSNNEVSADEYIDSYSLVSQHDNDRTEIKSFPFVIGRLSSCDLCILNRRVSRKHAIIQKTNNTLVINNENSLNGILVNNIKIKRVILQDGDEISIADQKYTFKVKRLLASDNVVATDEDQSASNITAQVIIHDTENTPVQTNNNTPENLPDRKRLLKKQRLIIFTLIIALVSVAGLLAYQYHMQQSKEARVFALTEQGSKTNDKDTEQVKVEKTVNNVEPDQVVATVTTENDTHQNDKTNQVVTTPDSRPTTVIIKPAITRQKTQAANKPNPKSSLSSTHVSQKKRLIERQNSEEKIRNAINLYHTGHFPQSIDALIEIETNKRHEPEYRLQAKKLNARIVELNNYYESGNKVFARDSKDEAFQYWEQLLSKHKLYFPEQQSHYVDEIKDKVAAEYERRGNQAYVKEQWNEAYTNWKNALSIRPREETQASVNLMDAEIKDLYRTGYRFETVNISRALEYWETLLQKAPRDHEYYIKAAAKIQWYKSRH